MPAVTANLLRSWAQVARDLPTEGAVADCDKRGVAAALDSAADVIIDLTEPPQCPKEHQRDLLATILDELVRSFQVGDLDRATRILSIWNQSRNLLLNGQQSWTEPRR